MYTTRQVWREICHFFVTLSFCGQFGCIFVNAFYLVPNHFSGELHELWLVTGALSRTDGQT